MSDDLRWTDETERLLDDYLFESAADSGCGLGHRAAPILAVLADAGKLVKPTPMQHYRVGPGICVCGYNAYQLAEQRGIIMPDYHEMFMNHIYTAGRRS